VSNIVKVEELYSFLSRRIQEKKHYKNDEETAHLLVVARDNAARKLASSIELSQLERIYKIKLDDLLGRIVLLEVVVGDDKRLHIGRSIISRPKRVERLLLANPEIIEIVRDYMNTNLVLFEAPPGIGKTMIVAHLYAMKAMGMAGLTHRKIFYFAPYHSIIKSMARMADEIYNSMTGREPKPRYMVVEGVLRCPIIRKKLGNMKTSVYGLIADYLVARICRSCPFKLSLHQGVMKFKSVYSGLFFPSRDMAIGCIKGVVPEVINYFFGSNTTLTGGIAAPTSVLKLAYYTYLANGMTIPKPKRRRSGIIVVDEADTFLWSLPEVIISTVEIDSVLPLAEKLGIFDFLVSFSREIMSYTPRMLMGRLDEIDAMILDASIENVWKIIMTNVLTLVPEAVNRSFYYWILSGIFTTPEMDIVDLERVKELVDRFGGLEFLDRVISESIDRFWEEKTFARLAELFKKIRLLYAIARSVNDTRVRLKLYLTRKARFLVLEDYYARQRFIRDLARVFTRVILMSATLLPHMGSEELSTLLDEGISISFIKDWYTYNATMIIVFFRHVDDKEALSVLGDEYTRYLNRLSKYYRGSVTTRVLVERPWNLEDLLRKLLERDKRIIFIANSKREAIVLASAIIAVLKMIGYRRGRIRIKRGLIELISKDIRIGLSYYRSSMTRGVAELEDYNSIVSISLPVPPLEDVPIDFGEKFRIVSEWYQFIHRVTRKSSGRLYISKMLYDCVKDSGMIDDLDIVFRRQGDLDVGGLAWEATDFEEYVKNFYSIFRRLRYMRKRRKPKKKRIY